MIRDEKRRNMRSEVKCREGQIRGSYKRRKPKRREDMR